MEKLDVASFQIIGIEVRTTNQNSQAINDIGALWGKFMEQGILKKIPNKVNSTIYCLYTDYEGDHLLPYTTVIGCEVSSIDEVPSGMVAKTIIEGAYLKSSAKGDLSKGLIGNHWYQLWDTEMDRNYQSDYEVYDHRASDAANAEVDFYIGINS